MNHFELSIAQVSGHSLAFLYFDLKGEKVNKFNREVIAEFESLIPVLKKRASEFEALILFSKNRGTLLQVLTLHSSRQQRRQRKHKSSLKADKSF